MAEHSPGPWSLAVSADRTPLVVAPGRSTGVAIIPFQRDEVCRQARIEETGANARLIAAAPELLRACQTFETWLRREEAGLPGGVVRDTPEGEARWREWYDENLRLCAEAQTQARAAIAKATGDSHD